MNTKLKILFTAALLVVSVFSSTTFCDEVIKVNINGEDLALSQEPVVVNGRTLVPLRSIFEALGVTPEWDSVNKTVKAASAGTAVSLKIDAPIAFINGKNVVLESPAILVNGRTMVPVRFVAESLGAKVNWNAEKRTVEVEKTLEPALTVPAPPLVAMTGEKSAPPTRPQGIHTEATSLTVETNPLYEYSIDWGATWQSSGEFRGLRANTTYGIMARVKATATTPASDPSIGTEMTTNNWTTNYLAKGKDCTDTTIILQDNPELEYSVDGGKTWQTESIISGLKPATAYIVLARLKGILETSATAGISITTDSEPREGAGLLEGPQRPRGASTSATSITLVADEQMEYSIDGGKTWQTSPEFMGLRPGTNYSFVQRFKATATDPASAKSNGETDITTDSLSNPG